MIEPVPHNGETGRSRIAGSKERILSPGGAGVSGGRGHPSPRAPAVDAPSRRTSDGGGVDRDRTESKAMIGHVAEANAAHQRGQFVGREEAVDRLR